MSMMSGMLRFEWRYHTYRVTFALIALVVCGMAWAMVATGYGPAGVHINSPYTIMQSFGLLALWTLFSQTIFTVNGVLRDDEYSMRELILSRPIGKARYLASRYLGISIAGISAMFLAMLVMMFAPNVAPIDPERIGSMRVSAYLWGFVTLIVPDVLLISALLFAVAAFTRRTLATYVGGIAIFGLYTIVAMMSNSPLMAGSAPLTTEGLARAAIIDPFGISAFYEQARYWTPAERDIRMASLSGHFLLNRALWLSVTAGVLWLTYQFVSLGATGKAAIKAQKTKASRPMSTSAKSIPAMAYAPLAPSQLSTAVFWSALRSATGLELKHIFKAWVFQALLVLWVCIYGIEAMSAIDGGEYGTHILATSGLLAERLIDPLKLVGSLCLVYFGAEIVWRERVIGFDQLIDATPASNGVFYLSKLLTLCSIPVTITLVGSMAAAAIQLSAGGLALKPLVLLAPLWTEAYPMVLLSVAVVLVQVLSGNRWIGMLASFALIVLVRAGDEFGLEHPMWRYTVAPTVRYSDLDGFGATATSFAAFMAYWSACALLLGSLGWSAWRRGRDAGAGSRLLRIWRAASHETANRWTVIAATLVAILGGSMLFRETNVVHAWQNSEGNVAWRVHYEQRYRRLQSVPQPSIVHVDINVDFEPSRRVATAHGALSLVNRTGVPVDTLWVAVRRDAAQTHVRIEGAREVLVDSAYGMRAFVLPVALLPEDSARLQYDLKFDRGGVRAGDFDIDVASNGSYLSVGDAMPNLGYRSGYELQDESERRKRGLGAATVQLADHRLIDSLSSVVKARGQEPAWITFRSTVSTSEGQVPLAPGRRVREWTHGDRRYAEYRIDSLVPARFAFVSGRYEVKRVQHGTVLVEFWYHPEHVVNVEHILNVAKTSLDVFGEKFGPYPRESLLMVEVPNGWQFGAFAMGGMLLFTEDRGMLSDPRDGEVNLLTRRVAHEIGHQWWGYVVDPLNVQGATTIVETLAKYSEQLVVARMHGDSAVPAVLAYDHDRYLSGRAADAKAEPTLETTTDQAYMYYGKGALAMHALQDALGDSIVNAVLHDLILREHGPRGAATAVQLHKQLRAAASTPALQSLVDEWFTQRVIYDLRVDSAVVTAVAAHEGVPPVFRTQAVVRVGRVTVEQGVERVTPADGVDIDVLLLDNNDQAMTRTTIHVSHGVARVTLEAGQLPTSVEIDPRVHWIDRDRSNNRTRVVKGTE